jgi:hypothetical protein
MTTDFLQGRTYTVAVPEYEERASLSVTRLTAIANLSDSDEDIIVQSDRELVPTNIPRGRTLLCRNDSLSNITLWMTSGVGRARITLIDEEASL